jgi:hypothetical protein
VSVFIASLAASIESGRAKGGQRGQMRTLL